MSVEFIKKNNFIKPLTRWAANELFNEDIADFYEMELTGFETDDFFKQDEVSQAINHWFPINNMFMLYQTKFQNKIKDEE